MGFWIIVGVVLALALLGGLVLDRRRGGGHVGRRVLDDHPSSAATMERNRAHQNLGNQQ